jgi:hypothetical protein
VFSALEQWVPLQPFLEDVMDIRFAELSVRGQFAMQGGNDRNSLGFHADKLLLRDQRA